MKWAPPYHSPAKVRSVGASTPVSWERMLEPTCKVFENHEEARAADRAYYASLSPRERLHLLLEIVARHRESLGEAAERFERVHRVVELSQS